MNKNELQWNKNFQLAKKYFEQYNNLLIPRYHITEDGINLGSWISNQRTAYKNNGKCKITSEQIKKLNSINMIWNPLEVQWEKNFQLAKEYFETYNNLLIPARYKTKDNIKLGSWLNKQRQSYKDSSNGKITPEQIRKLNSINIIWEPLKLQWEENFLLAKKYFEKYGDLLIPTVYKTKDDIKLGYWIHKQRQSYKGKGTSKITPEKINKLNTIGMSWDIDNSNSISFNELCVFYYIEKYFNDTINGDRIILNGKELDIYTPSIKIAIEYDGEVWHKNLIKDIKKDELCQEKGIKLIRIREPKCIDSGKSMCIIYKLHDNSFNSLSSIIEKILKNEYYIDVKVNIYDNYNEIHKLYKKTINKKWKDNFQLSKDYFKKYGNLLVRDNYVTEDGINLGGWILRQRQAYKGNENLKITSEQIVMLESINMVWNPLEAKWEEKFQLAKEYYETHGNLLIPLK